MEKKYVSFDIEASGRTPGKYSLISLGACIVGNTNNRFYREIKPITSNFTLSAMKISSRGLFCLDGLRHNPEFDHKSTRFDPNKVLDVLKEVGEEPANVMKDYASWVIRQTSGFKPTEAAAPIKFDAMFTTWYFDNFYEGENPFGHSGEDISSMYRGLMGNVDAHISDLGVRGKDLPHNALEDAIIQAKEFEIILARLKSK